MGMAFLMCFPQLRWAVPCSAMLCCLSATELNCVLPCPIDVPQRRGARQHGGAGTLGRHPMPVARAQAPRRGGDSSGAPAALSDHGAAAQHRAAEDAGGLGPNADQGGNVSSCGWQLLGAVVNNNKNHRLIFATCRSYHAMCVGSVEFGDSLENTDFSFVRWAEGTLMREVRICACL